MSKKQPVMSHDPLAELNTADQPVQPTARRSRRKAPAEKATAKPTQDADSMPAASTAEGAYTSSGDAMDADDSKGASTAEFVLPASLTIVEVAELHASLLESIVSQRVIRLDGSDVDTVDNAGLQLLTACRKEASNRNTDVQLTNPSDPLQRAITQVGLAPVLLAAGTE